MEFNIIISTIIKILIMTILTNLISAKLLDEKYNKLKLIIVALISLILAIIYILIKKYINTFTALGIIYLCSSGIIKIMHKYKLGNSMLITLVAMSICLVAFGLATLIAYVLHILLKIESYILDSLIIMLIQSTIVLIFFKRKRFKKGFAFLKDKNQNDYIDMLMLSISAIIMLAYYFFGNYNEEKILIHFLISWFALGMIFILLIKKSIELSYKQNLLKREIQEYQAELKEKDNIIKKLSNEKYEISRINHEFYNRQKALELKVKEFTSETSNELVILDRIENLTKEYSQNLQNIKEKEKLPLTNITEIDDMFSYMQSECNNNNIDFKLQIQGEIYYLINNIIPTNKLETLIGDLLRNAIIAINSSDSKYKSILTILGIKEECYELCVCDSGIEFEIETLLKLGLERATTHKETGGSGIGFMTTFKTLKESKASLIIEERHQIKEDDYTKVLKIRFDGKNEYKIISYRADSIKEKCKGEKRIIIDKFKN